ncbi:MAG: acyl-[acyl-carrier-protein] thioesterase [Lachnospiraceae bacterium]|nr:acyl-[acyl-carrier-protein] thioesterase [Lachnospiraceae bacterium]
MNGYEYEYEYEDRISFSRCDVNRRLSITALIDAFQDASIFQSEDAGVGIEFLKERDLLWVLNYWELEITRLPGLCETVLVGTYPFDFKSFMGYRNFYMKDEAGNYLVKANTTWTMVNISTMTPARAPECVVKAYKLGEKLDMTYSGRKILLPSEDECIIKEGDIRTVELHHLDTNMHVNNCQYINFAMTAVGEDIQVKSLRADYRKQAHLKDRIYPRIYIQGNEYTVALNDEDGVPYSVVKLKGEK